MQLNDKQIERYLHHIVLKDIGGEGQKKLLDSKVLIIGAGGLGSPAALYLAAAGVGTLGLADDDKVEVGNLQRQILYSMQDLGQTKVDKARERLETINSDVKVVAHPMRVTDSNIKSLISDYDFVIDATDNFETKLLINDACVELKKPFSHGGVVGFKGQTFTYIPKSMCLRCIFPEQPAEGCIQNCRGSGILGTVAGVIGSIQATEAIKLIIGQGELLTNKLLSADLLKMEIHIAKLQPFQHCPVCRA